MFLNLGMLQNTHRFHKKLNWKRTKRPREKQTPTCIVGIWKQSETLRKRGSIRDRSGCRVHTPAATNVVSRERKNNWGKHTWAGIPVRKATSSTSGSGSLMTLPVLRRLQTTASTSRAPLAIWTLTRGSCASATATHTHALTHTHTQTQTQNNPLTTPVQANNVVWSPCLLLLLLWFGVDASMAAAGSQSGVLEFYRHRDSKARATPKRSIKLTTTPKQQLRHPCAQRTRGASIGALIGLFSNFCSGNTQEKQQEDF